LTWFATEAVRPVVPGSVLVGAEMTGVAGAALTVTVAVAEFVDAQPFEPVTVSEYVVVEVGEAVGVQLEEFESPDEGDHEQEVPPEPESGVDVPAQIVAVPEATAVGRALTVTVTVGLFVDVQPAALVTVNVYVVFETGEADGLQLEAFESPVEGDHEQEVPPEPESGVELPAQIVAEPEAEAVGRGLTVTETGLELPEQLLEFVTLTL
jgi:hypothetical protein